MKLRGIGYYRRAVYGGVELLAVGEEIRMG